MTVFFDFSGSGKPAVKLKQRSRPPGSWKGWLLHTFFFVCGCVSVLFLVLVRGPGVLFLLVRFVFFFGGASLVLQV